MSRFARRISVEVAHQWRNRIDQEDSRRDLLALAHVVRMCVSEDAAWLVQHGFILPAKVKLLRRYTCQLLVGLVGVFEFVWRAQRTVIGHIRLDGGLLTKRILKAG